MTIRRRCVGFGAFLVALTLTCFLRADTIKDTLDAAKAANARAREDAEAGVVAAFEGQIKILSQSGDLDGVEALIFQRKAFMASKTMPTASSMRAASAAFVEAVATAELRLKTAYETAIAEYTKARRFDDAILTRRLMAERFAQKPASQPTSAPVASGPTDPVRAGLQSEKESFMAAVKKAHAQLIATIDREASLAADQGDLDRYKRFKALSDRVRTNFVVPEDVKDISVRAANAKFVQSGEAAHAKLRSVYEEAIRTYTKARRIVEAEAVKAEMGNGDWLEVYGGVPATIDLLAGLDLQKNTLRRGWRMRDGTLESTAWDNEWGPWIQIPVPATGSYELKTEFVLSRGQFEGLYFRIPVGKTAALVELHPARQSISIGDGDVLNMKCRPLALGQAHRAVFRVSPTDPKAAGIEVDLNGERAFEWKGTTDNMQRPFGGRVWKLEAESWFGVGTKTGAVREMRLTRLR